MSADTFASLRTAKLRRVMFAVFVANAAVQFAIQAWFAWRFAAEVWRIPWELSFLVPVALDVFVINLMVATYMARKARLRTRAYLWGTLGSGIVAQLAAAEAFAGHAEWSIPGRVASLAPAAFLALSLHALIIVSELTDSEPGARRASWSERRRAARLVSELAKSGTDPVIPAPRIRALPLTVAATAPMSVLSWTPELPKQPPQPILAPPGLTPPMSVSMSAPAAPRRPRPRPTPASASRRKSDPNRELAVKRVLAGESASAVARELGIPVRNVQLWAKAARDLNPDSPNEVSSSEGSPNPGSPTEASHSVTA